MNSKEQIFREVESTPEPLLEEVLNFIQFLKQKHLLSHQKIETVLLSESSLQKDWLTPEEDEAWQDL